MIWYFCEHCQKNVMHAGEWTNSLYPNQALVCDKCGKKTIIALLSEDEYQNLPEDVKKRGLE